jgi:CubicO group peptidase (beta-lactamase class C family)
MNAFRFTYLLAMTATLCMPAAPQSFTAKPEEAGMSTDRLKRVDTFMSRLQAEGRLAGVVTVVARRGQVVSYKAHGFADLESKQPMRVDDIFQIQSMTKPIATVGVLMLLEEGRLLLNDPIAKFLPEFGEMKVAVARPDTADGFDLVPAKRPITILDLLTHRAGFTGLPPRASPAATLRAQAIQSLPRNQDFTLEQYIRNLASSPLDAQPGVEFRYGPSTEVLGRLIEVVTGQSLDDALRDRIFSPLAMIDTHFVVPPEKRARIVTAYSRTPQQGLKRLPPDPSSPRFISAGGNLFSTAADYLRFCQMLLNGGELDGKRLLSRKTVELMLARQVDPLPLIFLPGQYFGLGVAVRKSDGESGLIGSPGSFGWSGGYNTYFRIDPQEQLIMMLFTQLSFSPTDLELQYGFHNTVMQAIVD